jgi:hypothetical protein
MGKREKSGCPHFRRAHLGTRSRVTRHQIVLSREAGERSIAGEDSEPKGAD